MNQDPRDTLAQSPMTAAQVRVVAITVGLCALDGFDVLAISFASPGIAREWGINRAALGVVLSMELIGMGVGSILLGGLADRVGRRSTVLGCLLVMTLGMALATTAHSMFALSLWRVITGLGIGGMLASLNAIASEFANARRRDLCVSADVDRLSARRDHRRLHRRGAAQPARLAHGVRVRRRGVRAADTDRVLVGAGIGRLAVPAATRARP